MDNAIVKRNPLAFPSLRGSFWKNWDDLWDDLDGMWMDSWFNIPTRKAFSSVDVKEERYELTYEVPGLEANELYIDRKDNLLTVKAEQDKKESGRYFNFEKSITLPDDADLDKIEANLKSGILKIIIPRIKEEEKKNQEVVKIAIKS